MAKIVFKGWDNKKVLLKLLIRYVQQKQITVQATSDKLAIPLLDYPGSIMDFVAWRKKSTLCLDIVTSDALKIVPNKVQQYLELGNQVSPENVT